MLPDISLWTLHPDLSCSEHILWEGIYKAKPTVSSSDNILANGHNPLSLAHTRLSSTFWM